ncbi:ATP-binding protein [Pelosinus sp. UFO1]|uniref:ATP-binding protein n=1 Tax=Pelosinus sp. UFO1 TaxID=484770 RepID=UPI0004D1091A|nr:ATP-binding protein [Pelosinus sp. UFO1]AIF53203.1 multi-sensor signal transduction histidine kinase [Pelosinus sp. UFO1]
MDYIVIGSAIGTISIILIYVYLYVLYRERYMGIWAAGWLILLSRYMIFDSGLFPWKQSILGLTIYQLLIITSVMFFTWATHSFIKKPLNKLWIHGTLIISVLSFSLNFLSSALIFKLLLPIYFGCFVCIWIGITFIRNVQMRGIGHLITGYSYILWSLLNLAAPIVLTGSWLLPVAHFMGGVLRLFIAIGTLMVYFESTRMDLVKKETQYRLLAENAADIIYSYQFSPKPKIDYISPSVLQLTGYSPEEYYADNKLIFNLIHSDDYSFFTEFIHNFPNSIELPLTLRLDRKDNTILWIEQKCTPIYDKNGDLITLQGIIRDVTTRKNLEKMTSMLDRMNMVGSMAATVAHEIRNPLTTVRGYLQVMGRKEKYQTDKEKFKLMIEEMDRANSIIREYLSLSREKLANLEKCSLNLIIEALFPLIQADANSSKVYVSLDLTAISELLLDENEIRQLLLNLIRNSIEAMPEGGNLIIHTSQEGDKTILSISDQGSGIPSHILDNLGTPFMTTKDTGTGLGLPICYQIAHRHNASIKINTSHEGTTFFINFRSPIL